MKRQTIVFRVLVRVKHSFYEYHVASQNLEKKFIFFLLGRVVSMYVILSLNTLQHVSLMYKVSVVKQVHWFSMR